jgi:hypothetical protein
MTAIEDYVHEVARREGSPSRRPEAFDLRLAANYPYCAVRCIVDLWLRVGCPPSALSCYRERAPLVIDSTPSCGFLTTGGCKLVDHDSMFHFVASRNVLTVCMQP